MDKPKRVAVIGLDCAITSLIDKHIAEGYLPTFKRIFEGGAVAENCIVPYPTITPPNWTTIGTGALIGTHQITDFWLPIPGETPTNLNVVQALNSERSQAEYLWDAADKAGKKCIVLNFPTSWPNHMRNGVMVAGAGITPGEHRDGFRGADQTYSLCHNQCISTGVYPGGVRGQFSPAEGWRNLDEPGDDPLEMAARLSFQDAAEPVAPTTWYLLARQSEGKGYDRITLSPTKDLHDAFCTLSVGEWSAKIATHLEMADGSVRRPFFRCKLIELSPDAEDFLLFLTALVDMSPWCSPPELVAKLDAGEGVPVPSAGVTQYNLGVIDADTLADCADLYTLWVTDAATSLFEAVPDWDLFMMHCHPPDYIYHALMTDMDPDLTKDEAKRAKAWEVHRRVYESQDRLIARIIEAVGSDTLVVLVSDHGATPEGPNFDPYKILTSAGLAVLKPVEKRTNLSWGEQTRENLFGAKPDVVQCKALAQRMCHVYVHLKGRDPEGIVEPEDYEKVQQEIIDAFLTYVDPATGRRPVSLALSKQDARILGLYGDAVGDVVYALYPWFGSQHGHILPTARWGVGDLRALFALHGPGIKKGVRLQRTVGLEDLVPTICHLADLPLPAQVDGAVIYQAFEDPDFKRKEFLTLTEALAKLEAALAAPARPAVKCDC